MTRRLAMSRAHFSIRRPRHGGTFRPLVEALEDRLAPGSLLGASPPHAITPCDIEDPDFALLVGRAFSSQLGVIANAQDQVVTTRPVVDFATRSIVFGE